MDAALSNKSVTVTIFQRLAVAKTTDAAFKIELKQPNAPSVKRPSSKRLFLVMAQHLANSCHNIIHVLIRHFRKEW